MLIAEFHCHTIFSKDSLTKPEALLAACRRKGIDRVVVTDHNAIEGARRAQALDPGRVIVGEEIMTRKGELLAAYVKELVPSGLPPREAIERLRLQGAFISVSHPFDLRRNGAWALDDLLEITPLVDAIEVFNSRCLEDGPNRLAQEFARKQHLLGTAGSDAHLPYELGRAVLRLPEFDDPHSLIRALGEAEIEGRISPPWVHFGSYFSRVWKQVRRIHPQSAFENQQF
jgi:predicted metal-dependent phosphoesterase TrpH